MSEPPLPFRFRIRQWFIQIRLYRAVTPQINNVLQGDVNALRLAWAAVAGGKIILERWSRRPLHAISSERTLPDLRAMQSTTTV
jgi:hypothetical protein